MLVVNGILTASTSTNLTEAVSSPAVQPGLDVGPSGTYRCNTTNAVFTQANTFALMNDGTVEVVQGMLDWQAGGTSTGAFAVASGATLDFDQGTFDLSAASFSGLSGGAGMVVFSSAVAPALGGSYDLAGGETAVTGGGTVEFGAGLALTSLGDVLDVDSGTATLGQNATVPTFELASGTIEGPGDLTVTSFFEWGSGTVATVVTLADTGTGSFLFTTKTLGAGATLTLDGDVNWEAGQITGQEGAVLTNNATLASTTPSALARAASDLTVDPVFENNGTYTLSINPTNSQSNSYTLDNTGTLQALQGRLRWAGSGTNAGTLLADAGAEVELTNFLPAVFTNAAAGVIGGDGTFNEPSQPTAFVNEGTFAPGASPGVLAYDGDYSQADASTTVLAIEIGGPTVGAEYDQLNVDGDVTLGGTLDVSILDGYDPAIGESFDVLTWTGTRTGTFTTTQGLELAGGKVFELQFMPDRLTLVVVAGSGNTPPDANDDALTVLEDATDAALDVLANDADGDGDPLALTLDTAPSNGTAAVSDSGTPGDLTDDVILYTPNADFFGTDSFSYSIDDGIGGTDMATVTVTVDPVNDEPSFTIVPDPGQTIEEDAGTQTIPGFVTGFTPGPANELGQTPTYVLTDSPNLIVTASVDPVTGDLTYTPFANAVGTTTVSIVARDDGGTANGGDNQSPPQTFTVTITPVNDPPTFVLQSNQTVGNSAGPQTVPNFAFNIDEGGGTDEDSQTVTFVVTNTDNALFSDQPAIASDGTLTYTPQPGQAGTATLAVVAMDDGGTANGGSDTSAPQVRTITVTQDNAPPVITSLTGDTSGDEGSTFSFTVAASDPEGDDLVYTWNFGDGTAVQSGVGLASVSHVYAGDGSYTLTLTVTDGDGGSATSTLAITVVQ